MSDIDESNEPSSDGGCEGVVSVVVATVGLEVRVGKSMVGATTIDDAAKDSSPDESWFISATTIL